MGTLCYVISLQLKETGQPYSEIHGDLAAFLWKWALALLVISNNWLSVGVAIAGVVVYPLVVFWQIVLFPDPSLAPHERGSGI